MALKDNLSTTVQTDAHYDKISKSRGRVYPNQVTVYHQGDPLNGFFRVNSGVVMVYRLLEDSQRQITGFYTEGDCFGLSAGGTYQDTAVTVATSNIVSLMMSDVRKSVSLQSELLTITCGQLSAAQDLITTLTKKTASEKVATFLLMQAKSQKKSGDDFDIRLPMSRLDIADYLGLSIETVSRRFTELKSKGIIALPNRNTAKICHFAKLKSLAGVT
jgi:CRP/FNR family transcriptional regulator